MELIIVIIYYITASIMSLMFLIDKRHKPILWLDAIVLILTLPVVLLILILVAMTKPSMIKNSFSKKK